MATSYPGIMLDCFSEQLSIKPCPVVRKIKMEPVALNAVMDAEVFWAVRPLLRKAAVVRGESVIGRPIQREKERTERGTHRQFDKVATRNDGHEVEQPR